MNDQIEVLLVDNNPDDARHIRHIMTTEGALTLFHITHIELFADAIQFLKENKPHLVVCSFNQQGLLALDDIQALLQSAPSIPIVILIPKGNEAVGIAAKKRGAQDYLVKDSITYDFWSRIFLHSIKHHSLQVSFKNTEQHLLQSTIDALKHNVAILSSSGDILAFNRSWQALADNGDLGGKERSPKDTYLTLCDHISGPGANEALAIAAGIRAVIQGEKKTFEIEYLCQLPHPEHWYQCRVATFSDDPPRFIVTLEDITKQKLSEAPFKEGKNWPQYLADLSPNCIYITDAKNRYLIVNQSLADLYGIAKSELIGKRNSELSCNSLTRIKSTSKAPPLEVNKQQSTHLVVDSSFILPDGAVHWYSTIRKPIKWPGETDCTLNIAINLTELCNAQDEIRNSELRLQAILDAQSSSVVLLDSQRQVLWPNSKACQTAGLSRQEMIGHKCQHVWKNQIIDCESCPVEHALKKGKASSIQQTTPDGHIWRIHGFPIQDDMGRVVSAVEVVEDVTKQISLEGQLRQAQKMESLGTLAGGIAHDFNNILSGILGYTELALENAKESKIITDYLNEVFGAGLRATELTKQILTFSRRANIALSPLSIKRVVQEATKLLRPTLPTTIEFKVQLDHGIDQILADPTQIHQIVINLCTNASHAMEPFGGVLGIELSQLEIDSSNNTIIQSLTSGKYIKLAISDTGCGMSSEIMSSIFDPYFTTKDLGEGTGLGLSVVHGIVKEYGGDILVDSSPGIGTTFTLFFPTVPTDTTDSNQQVLEHLPTGSERILIVDDEPIILKLCTRILTKQGYQVIAESDSLKALKRFEDNPESFDLVFADVTMPKLTGDLLATQLMAIRPEIPVILCTGYSRVVSEESAKKLGVRALLTKPVVKQQMITEVRRVLDDTT